MPKKTGVLQKSNLTGNKNLPGKENLLDVGQTVHRWTLTDLSGRIDNLCSNLFSNQHRHLSTPARSAATCRLAGVTGDHHIFDASVDPLIFAYLCSILNPLWPVIEAISMSVIDVRSYSRVVAVCRRS